jgi:hypothetical protein
VRIEKTPRNLLDLSTAGGHAIPERFLAVLAAFLQKTPLTDVATMTRGSPEFRFSDGVLALAATRAGRTLALRALQPLEGEALETALGRALRELLTAPSPRILAGPDQAPVAAALALLGERALQTAQQRFWAGTVSSNERAIRANPAQDALAQVVSARAAMQLIERVSLSEGERAGMLAILRPLAAMTLSEPAASLLPSA